MFIVKSAKNNASSEDVDIWHTGLWVFARFWRAKVEIAA